MAEGDETPVVRPDRAQERAAAKESGSDEVRYSIDDLMENPLLLGDDVNRHAIAGAFFDADRKTFTLTQAADVLKKWLKKPAEEGDA